jgi:phage terminase Nu1 subunit (DNA packaging protein)
MSESETVTEKELAEFFDCSTRRIRQLATTGIAVREGRGRYLKDASTRSYIKHLRESAAGRTNSSESGLNLPDESARLKAAQAEYYDIKNQRSRGELVLAAEVEAEMRQSYRTTAQRLMAVPTTVAPKIAVLKTAAECEAVMRREFEKALNALSDEAGARLQKLEAKS